MYKEWRLKVNCILVRKTCGEAEDNASTCGRRSFRLRGREIERSSKTKQSVQVARAGWCVICVLRIAQTVIFVCEGGLYNHPSHNTALASHVSK